LGKSKEVAMGEAVFYLGGETEIRRIASIAGRKLDNMPLLPKIIFIA
jgi:hypothetical protein